MEFAEYIPVWKQLTVDQQDLIRKTIVSCTAEKGTMLHNGSVDCAGLILVKSGQLRAYILSDEGREITLYRLFDMDICLFSASCVLRSVQFEIMIQAEKETQYWVIPPHIYKRLMEQSAPMANYTNDLMASRFSEVMWLIEQIMWKSLDKRLAAFLLEEAAIEETNRLTITHEMIANHLGTHREVVTRMLRYFRGEGMVALTRGTVELTDTAGLKALRGE